MTDAGRTGITGITTGQRRVHLAGDAGIPLVVQEGGQELLAQRARRACPARPVRE